MKTAVELQREIESLGEVKAYYWQRWCKALEDWRRAREAYAQALQAERQNPPAQSLVASEQPSDWDDAEHGVTRR